MKIGLSSARVAVRDEGKPHNALFRASGPCLRASLIGGAALMIAGCKEMPLVSNPTDRSAARLEIEIGSTSLYTGESTPVHWRLFDQDDREIDQLPAWVSPRWDISTPIASFSDGKIQSLIPGQTTLTLSIGGASASTGLRINPGSLTTKIEAAYITQVVQRLDGSVPLVAGRPGVLRVFVTGDQLNYFLPSVRARFFRGGNEIETLTAVRGSTGIPQGVLEGTMGQSWNISVPASLIAPGTSILVELDTDSGLRAGPASVLKFPANGVAKPLDVRSIPTFRITFVPIAITNFATGDVSATNVDYYMAAARQVWPFSTTDVIVREPYSTSTRSLTDEDWSDLLREIRLLRAADQSSRYYHGILRREGAWSGLGYIGFPAAISRDGSSTWTVAHELGHNFGRNHAPCGGPGGPDPLYPHSGGTIGVYGLEADGTTIHPPTRVDLMSYCSPRWVSDYSYMGVVNRLQAQAPLGAEALNVRATSPLASPATGTMLMVSGEIGSARAKIDPAFIMETAPLLPERSGPYTLEGRDASGALIFSVSFEGEQLGDGPDDRRHFVFAIPVSSADAARLASLRVSGAGKSAERRLPGAASELTAIPRLADIVSTVDVMSMVNHSAANGSVSLVWDGTRYPLLVVRNPVTGGILAMGRNGGVTVRTDARELELLLSDGLRSSVQRVVINKL